MSQRKDGCWQGSAGEAREYGREWQEPGYLPVDRSTHEALGWLSWHHLLLNHEVGVQHVYRQLHKHRACMETRRTLCYASQVPGQDHCPDPAPPPTGGARLCSSHRGPQGGDDISHSPHRSTKLAERPEQGHLINCLERTPILVETERSPGSQHISTSGLPGVPATCPPPPPGQGTCSRVLAAPPRSRTGDWAIWAFFTAVTVLVRPGPAVTAATPTVPGTQTLSQLVPLSRPCSSPRKIKTLPAQRHPSLTSPQPSPFCPHRSGGLQHRRQRRL